VIQLQASVTSIAATMKAMGLSWCVVGGLAVSARAEPRFTQDVDLAVIVQNDQDAAFVIHTLRSHGYVPFMILEHETQDRLATVRLQRENGRWREIVDLIFASTGIEREICTAARELELMPGLRVPVAQAGHLLAMKLLSRDQNRPQDDMDLRSLLEVADADDLASARGAVLLIEARGYARGKNLVEGLKTLVTSQS